MFDVDQLIADAHDALAEQQPVLAVKEILERAVRHPADIDAALGGSDRWGMRTLHAAHDLTILQLVWPPHVILFPHDHRMWAANAIYGGAEDNTFYRRTADGIEVSGGAELSTGDVALLGADAIHSVANPRRTYTAAIHVYGGDYFGAARSQWDAVTGAEGPFDPEAVRRTLEEADVATRADGDPPD